MRRRKNKTHRHGVHPAVPAPLATDESVGARSEVMRVQARSDRYDDEEGDQGEVLM